MGNEINNVAELDSLLDQVGEGQPLETDEPEEEVEEEIEEEEEEVVEEPEEVEEPETEEVEEVEEPEEGDDDEKKKKTKTKKKTQPKDHRAFAAMRKKNSQLQETLTNIARGLGIDPSDEQAMMDQLQDAAINGIAKRTGKSKEEVIADSQAQRELNAYRAKDIRDHTTRSFNNIRDEFSVDNKRLAEFANRLVEQGYDPLQQKEDWEGLYKTMYFDEIVQQRVDSAVEEALKRDKAAEQSSGKSKKKGKRASSSAKISSMSELDKFLDDNF